ncbi:MAG: hypothetical protein ACRBEQ_05845 [Hyphomonas sp.]
MADGSLMRADTQKSENTLSVEQAISRLEAGTGDGITVDLGNGRSATADGHRGDDGLLQRLRGHKMLQALASGNADLSRFTAADETLKIAPLVQEILDAAQQKS